MHKLIKSLLLVTTIFIYLASFGCSTPATPSEPAADETEAIEEPEQADKELTEEEEEEEPKEEATKSSKQSTTSGSGFQHTVKMEIDGVIETDKNEGWWDLD
jgi:hypothetical protein